MMNDWYVTMSSFLQQESVNNLRKSQSLYVTRQQEYEKAKELSQKTETDALQSTSSSNHAAKVDKKRKAEEEALHKVGSCSKLSVSGICTF